MAKRKRLTPPGPLQLHAAPASAAAAMPVTAGVTELFRKMVADGWGERDNTEMVKFYRKASRGSG